MQNATLWRALLGIEKTVIEDIEFDEDEQLLVAHVRPRKRARGRCGRCGRRSPAYDRGEGRRRWRALDLGTIQAVLEAEAPRVRCPRARADGGGGAVGPARAGHTYAFDEQVAWLATQCSKTAVTELMRIAWRTVGAIITRVWADVEALHDRFAELSRIGIDEISYKRGHRYLTVVVDHDSGRLVWAAPGRDKATLERFFDALGPGALRPDHPRQRRRRGLDQRRGRRPLPERGALRRPVPRRASGPPRPSTRSAARPGTPPPPTRRHAVARAGGRADGSAKTPPATPRRSSTPATRCGRTPRTSPPDSRPSWPGSPRPTPRCTGPTCSRKASGWSSSSPTDEAVEALEAWIGWARRCRIPTFVDLQRRIVKHQASILAAIEHGLSNGRIESVNTKIRLITRVAFGFKSPDALIALAMLNLGGHRPALPGRTMTHGSVRRAHLRRGGSAGRPSWNFDGYSFWAGARTSWPQAPPTSKIPTFR